MNIFPLTQAEQALREAHFFTVDGTDRNEIAEEHERVLKLLRKRGVFMGSLPGTEPAPKAAAKCPECNGTGTRKDEARCLCLDGGYHPLPVPRAQSAQAQMMAAATQEQRHAVIVAGLRGPIMDEDDLRRDLQRLCQEQQETIATLKSENDAWRADSQSLSRLHNLLCESMPGFKGCPSPPDWCFAALQELLEQRMLLNGNLADMTKRYEHLERLYFQVTGKNDSPATNGTIKAAKQIMARVDATTLREA